ncbi:rhodanese-like domain-containing protein [Acaryochloris sp. CCMEE 5410]|uniref:rhodanese-like domain-containing protein n=1 Tax=Acaryochloris sp. CCMEE 5410 TaxID=310037 RepID=UPI0002485248|nr:rhodanese-like domain-containing protein [Acaryochloris sp. CCMEE 5410]
MQRRALIWMPVPALVMMLGQTSCVPSWEAHELITPTQLLAQINAGNPPVILDVRTVEEYEAGHIPGAIQIYFRDVPKRIQDLQSFASQDVVVYCERGFRAQIAETALQEAGFDRLYHLDGDIKAWRQAKFPVEKGPGTQL